MNSTDTSTSPANPLPETDIPLLRDVMTASPIYVDIGAPVSEAEALMKKHQVNHLPVMADGTLESIISDRGIKRVTLPGHRFSGEEELLVSDICPSRAYVADINDPLDKILNTMVDEHISAVIVLADGELAGIFTERDACRMLAQIYSP